MTTHPAPPSAKATFGSKYETLLVRTHGRGLIPLDAEVDSFLKFTAPIDGLLTLFVRHTSASLLIQENADPSVRHDLETFFKKLVVDGARWHTHTAEGPDDMPSHIRAALTQTSISIPIISRKPVLGTWQGLYLYEHRTHPHKRQVVLHYQGTHF